VPPLVVLVVCRLAWVWAKSHDRGDEAGFGALLRRALWLD
jgi:hypothetical protein